MGCHNPRSRGNSGKYSCPLAVYILMGMCMITNKWKHPLVISTMETEIIIRWLGSFGRAGVEVITALWVFREELWNKTESEQSPEGTRRERGPFRYLGKESSKQREKRPWGRRIQVQTMKGPVGHWKGLDSILLEKESHWKILSGWMTWPHLNFKQFTRASM